MSLNALFIAVGIANLLEIIVPWLTKFHALLKQAPEVHVCVIYVHMSVYMTDVTNTDVMPTLKLLRSSTFGYCFELSPLE